MLVNAPPVAGDEAELADDSKHCPDTTEHEHQGPAFALDYGSTGEQAAKPTTVAAAGPRPPLLPPTEDSRPATSIADHAAQYLPPYEHVPEQLADHLPKSQRQHQVRQEQQRPQATCGGVGGSEFTERRCVLHC